jgi:hypothetical protein
MAAVFTGPIQVYLPSASTILARGYYDFCLVNKRILRLLFLDWTVRDNSTWLGEFEKRDK